VNGGIVNQASKRATLDYKNLHNYKKNRNFTDVSHDLKKLNISDFIGLLALFSIGGILSTIAFSFETLKQK